MNIAAVILLLHHQQWSVRFCANTLGQIAAVLWLGTVTAMAVLHLVLKRPA